MTRALPGAGKIRVVYHRIQGGAGPP